MTNEMIRPGDNLFPDVVQLSTDDLKKELATHIGVTARTLARMADVWMELERRGEDLSALRGGLTSYLPAIADGRLDPEAVVRCAGQASVLKWLSQIPLQEQRTLLTGGAAIVEMTDDGPRTVTVSIENLTIMQARRLFAANRLRAPKEQIRILAHQMPSGTEERGTVEVKIRFSRAEYDALRRLAGAERKRIKTYLKDFVSARILEKGDE